MYIWPWLLLDCACVRSSGRQAGCVPALNCTAWGSRIIAISLNTLSLRSCVLRKSGCTTKLSLLTVKVCSDIGWTAQLRRDSPARAAGSRCRPSWLRTRPVCARPPAPSTPWRCSACSEQQSGRAGRWWESALLLTLRMEKNNSEERQIGFVICGHLWCKNTNNFKINQKILIWLGIRLQYCFISVNLTLLRPFSKWQKDKVITPRGDYQTKVKTIFKKFPKVQPSPSFLDFLLLLLCGVRSLGSICLQWLKSSFLLLMLALSLLWVMMSFSVQHRRHCLVDGEYVGALACWDQLMV